MPSRESTPVLLADNIKRYIKSFCPPDDDCSPGHSPGHPLGGSTPDSLQGLDGVNRSRVETVAASLDGRVQKVVLDFSFFPKVKVHWCNKGHLREQVIEVQDNAVFLGIRCPKCKRLVTAVTLLRGIRCNICTNIFFYTNPKKVIDALREAHVIIEKYDPCWEGLQAFGRHEWIDGY